MASSDAKFREEVCAVFGKSLLQELTPSQTSIQARNLEGKLKEGIRTKMTLGDTSFLGEPSDTPVAGSVEDDKKHYYTDVRLEQTPLSLLLPVLTVAGEPETANGQWRLVHEVDRTRVWAFLLVMAEKKQDQDQTLYLKMLSVAKEAEVLLLGLQQTDALWQEWSRAQDTALTSLHFSTERATIRYLFMAKLEASLQQQRAGEKVLRKDVWLAFQEAEAAAKFTPAKGKSGINRESDVAQIMSWGDYMKKWHLLDVWRDLEVGQEGKTPLYFASFATTFVALVNTGQDEASYVLQQLKKIYLQDPRGKAQLTKKKLLDAKASRMKAIVKTLDLQYLWCKSLIGSCEAQLIQAPLKMQATPPLADPTRHVITDPIYPYLRRVVMITTIPSYDKCPICHGPSRGH
jgi:hypothetical protein